MPNIALTSDELTIITQAVEAQITSAQRAQKTGKTPQIIEVFKTHETVLKDIAVKIAKAAAMKS